MNWKDRLAERLPLDRLRQSYEAISFSPQKRAEQDLAGMAEWLEGIMPKLADDAEREEVFAGFVKRAGALVAARGRTMSPMITGPARFPVDRNRKRMDIEHKRIGEYLDYQKMIAGRIAKRNQPERVISGDDPDAIDKLRAKRAQVQADWEQRKRWNAEFRKGGVEAMQGIGEGLRRSVAALMEREKWIKVPFSLTGFGPEIKRIDARIAALEARKEVEAMEREIKPGVRLEVAPDDNRVRLYFDGKPELAVRNKLKRNGFKWAPSVGAWQRQYSEQAIYLANNAVFAA